MQRRNFDLDGASTCAQVVRLGSQIYISGTTGIDGRGLLQSADPYAQALQALRNVEGALQQLGGGRRHVVRARVSVASSKYADSVQRAFAEFFGGTRPPISIVESVTLPPEVLVEVEADAVLS